MILDFCDTSSEAKSNIGIICPSSIRLSITLCFFCCHMHFTEHLLVIILLYARSVNYDYQATCYVDGDGTTSAAPIRFRIVSIYCSCTCKCYGPCIGWVVYGVDEFMPSTFQSRHIYSSNVCLPLAVQRLKVSFGHSSRAPGLTSGLQGSVNVHHGALLLVPQFFCILHLGITLPVSG